MRPSIPVAARMSDPMSHSGGGRRLAETLDDAWALVNAICPIDPPDWERAMLELGDIVAKSVSYGDGNVVAAAAAFLARFDPNQPPGAPAHPTMSASVPQGRQG